MIINIDKDSQPALIIIPIKEMPNPLFLFFDKYLNKRGILNNVLFKVFTNNLL